MPTAISTKAATRKVKASAPKALTVAKATAEAGRIARLVMPGALITVDSRGSWDMATDTQIVITTVTFPANDLRMTGLYLALLDIDHMSMDSTAESITITRRVR